MPGKTTVKPRITKFTNCRLVTANNRLVEQDLWVDSLSGKILQDQVAFYDLHLSPDKVIDLGGRILAPGLIDVQLNGAQGFDFSVPQSTKDEYDEGLRMVNKGLVRTGVTAYLPTVVSSTPEVCWKVLPSLGPSGPNHRAEDGAESLGAHVEGPFISEGRNGIHKPNVLRVAKDFADLVECYGKENISSDDSDGSFSSDSAPSSVPSPSSSLDSLQQQQRQQSPTGPIKMITAAPEVGQMMDLIPGVVSRGIVYSIGHSDASYEEGLAALSRGATMITHLFNAMRPFKHRSPGIFGLLGQSDTATTRRTTNSNESQSHAPPRPYYGLIADGIHLHPTSIKIAYNAHPAGLILVTDAMKLCGLPDGIYEWTNGERIVKTGARLTLEGSDKIAGSSATLIECVNNFRRWSGASIAEAVNAVTATPAKMLGLDGVKGSLVAGADADLVVLGETVDEFEGPSLTVDQVWKFGVKIHDVTETVGEK